MRKETAPVRPSLVWVAAIVAVIVLGGGYLVWVARAATPAGPAPAASIGDLLVVDQTGGRSDVVSVDPRDPGRAPAPTGLHCQRIYRAAGITSCMQLAGLGPTYRLDVLGPGGAQLRSIDLPGIPSRTRVSASGRIVSWTVFVTGDSYRAPGGFSTRTGFFDVRTGRQVDTLEGFVLVGGSPVAAADTNYWGMTVASDDRTFYATMATGEHHWLVKGDLETRTLTEVRDGAECPSLSPDGSRVVYKKRTGRLGDWQLAVLDLGTGTETLLPGTEGVDDQAAWIDDGTLAYGMPADSGKPPSVYSTRIDGKATPVLVAASASSPVPSPETP